MLFIQRSLLKWDNNSDVSWIPSIVPSDVLKHRLVVCISISAVEHLLDQDDSTVHGHDLFSLLRSDLKLLPRPI